MKTLKIVAREAIINPSTNKIHDDDGLKALGGYYEKIIKVEDEYDIATVINDFCVENPNFKDSNIEIKVIN